MKIFDISGVKIVVDSYLPDELELPKREREKHAVLRLIKDLTGDEVGEIYHYDDGAPYLSGKRNICISVSHCNSHVAVGVGECIFGLDIERWRSQLERVKDKYLTAESQKKWALNEASLLQSWTIMEAAYKAARRSGIDIKKDISFDSNGNCRVDTRRYSYVTEWIEKDVCLSIVIQII
ncbi:MAG: 4'-phosphopantetheinyl transferase superfamily protein [Muribaculum sp.]|nr:4'-phosphopantetheinyl transferase superfamily protein [Muribaculaceae bacterium]MCM1081324.1 4'-phosphopantetheinyl transferase superfamily protein [Muribaculum sp.]